MNVKARRLFGSVGKTGFQIITEVKRDNKIFKKQNQNTTIQTACFLTTGKGPRTRSMCNMCKILGLCN